mmetsp:Transcript_5593/g.7442  ORF Transcript_5593/g.7442 Transcript_5593/m.7442 type:complete len:96 (+) Transcript_5593:127-414(+)
MNQHAVSEEEKGALKTTAEQELAHLQMLTEAVKHLEDENTLIKKVVGRELIELKKELEEAKAKHERLVTNARRTASTKSGRGPRKKGMCEICIIT